MIPLWYRDIPYKQLGNKNQEKKEVKTMKNMTMTTSQKINTLVSNQALEKICKKLLMSLYARGNAIAYDIYCNRNNGLVTVEDLTQELYLYLLDNPAWILTQGGKIVFADKETEKGFYAVVSTYMYRQRTRHDNRTTSLYIETEDRIVSITDVQGLAALCDGIITIDTNAVLTDFIRYARQRKPKKADLIKEFLTLRLQGISIKEISAQMGIETHMGYDLQKQLKRLWKDFQNQK